MAVFDLYASNFLRLAQTLDPSVHYVPASNVLTFVQSATCNVKRHDASNTLHFQQLATVNVSYQRDVAQQLNLAQRTTPRIHYCDVYQSLGLLQRLERLIQASNRLTFVQEATVEVSRLSINHHLTFVQTATCRKITVRNVSQHLTFQSAATQYSLDVCAINGPITSPPLTDGHSGVTFEWGGVVLTLPSPDFSNVERQEFNRINRRTRGGDLIIKRDPMWPQAETFLMRWSSLKKEHAQGILNFAKLTLGQLVTLTTHEGRVFNGIIRVPDDEISQPKRKMYSAQLSFELQ